MQAHVHVSLFFRLGAWQFMADMPYGSLSLLTLWKILWTLYNYQMTDHRVRGTTIDQGGERERRGSVLNDRYDLDFIPETSDDIINSTRGKNKSYFIHQ